MAPKKQFQIEFREPLALIPDTARAKKWILSAKLAPGQPDKTFVGNPAIFASYRRYGELQKKYLKSWPKEGSVEDLASRAWSPNTLSVILIFQGRFVGLFNIMEKVQVLEGGGRVWLPEEETTPKPKKIEGVKIPKGNYFLEQEISTDREYWLYSFMFPTYPVWVGEALAAGYPDLPYASWPVMTIDYPKDAHFNEYNQDEESKDVSKLRKLLLKIMKWAEDPVANDEVLAQVIDMKSLARWYLTEEITREGDAYLVSQKWKFVKGKLYHASLWDFGGNSFMATCNDGFIRRGTMYIDFETNKIEEIPCNESTDFMFTTGWHVDSLYYQACMFEESSNCDSLEPGTALNDTKVWDQRHFFRYLFRAPSLQREFWALFDLVVEHGLVHDVYEDEESENDMFNFGGLIDLYHQKVKEAAEVDLKIWSISNAIINMMHLGFPVVAKEECKPILYEYLNASKVSNETGNVASIPAREWSFDQVSHNSQFFDFFPAAAKTLSNATGILKNWNWPAYTSTEAVTSAKKFIKARLLWIASQKKNYHDSDATFFEDGKKVQEKARIS